MVVIVLAVEGVEWYFDSRLIPASRASFWGFVHYLKGDYAAAARLYRSDLAARVSPRAPAWWKAYLAGDLPAAERLARQGLHESPDDVEILLGLAEIALAGRRFQDALDFTAQVLAPQRRRMVIAERSLGDIVSGPGRSEHLSAPAGIPAGELGAPQRERLGRLVEEYARNMRAEIAELELRRAREAGIERLHFAWAGPIEPGRAHYYRVHGPTLLIELDNTQNDANHIHSVWHDPRNGFGADLLRAHYERGHRHRQA